MFDKIAMRVFLHLSIVVILGLGLSACVPDKKFVEQKISPAHLWNAEQLEILKQFVLPSDSSIQVNSSNSHFKNKDAAAFGKNIFFNKSFSSNKEVACASCHKPELYFTDGRDKAIGLKLTSRNTPTVVGVSKNQWFFHDGRSDSLWSQALGPLENDKEHGANRSFYAHVINNNLELRLKYEKIFGGFPDLSNTKRFPINAGPVIDSSSSKAWSKMTEADKNIITSIFVNIGKSIAAYEQYLQPSKSRVDNYIESLVKEKTESVDKILSNKEARGLRLFIGKARCVICHFGPTYSDSEFHNIATVGIENKPYDWGRYNGAKQLLASEFNCRSKYNDSKIKQCDELQYMPVDSHETMASFKTPSLRNVSKTAPYMHDGQFKDLAGVVNHYDNADKLILGKKDLLPVELSKQNQSDLVAFLKALDSDIQPLPNWLKSIER